MAAATDFLRLVGVKRTQDPWVFESVSMPGSMGNIRPIAYGGCAIAVAINAAGQTVKSDARLMPYAITGQFLGPASLDAHFLCHVQPLRDTRSFATRHVLVKQQTRKGLRSCLALTLDMVASPLSTKKAIDAAKARGRDPAAARTLMRYEPQPRLAHQPPEQLELPADVLRRRVDAGELDEQVVAFQNDFLSLWNTYFDQRVLPGSVLTERLMGMVVKDMDEDKLPVQDRMSGDWFRLHQKLPPGDGSDSYTSPPEPELPMSAPIAHAAVCAFALDGALAFLPLPTCNRSIMEASAASTIEFTTRFHTDYFDMNEWHVREMHTRASGWSRTFSEALLWDKHGRLVASCSQQGVLAPAATEDDDSGNAPSSKL